MTPARGPPGGWPGPGRRATSPARAPPPAPERGAGQTEGRNGTGAEDEGKATATLARFALPWTTWGGVSPAPAASCSPARPGRAGQGEHDRPQVDGAVGHHLRVAPKMERIRARWGGRRPPAAARAPLPGGGTGAPPRRPPGRSRWRGPRARVAHREAHEGLLVEHRHLVGDPHPGHRPPAQASHHHQRGHAHRQQEEVLHQAGPGQGEDAVERPRPGDARLGGRGGPRRAVRARAGELMGFYRPREALCASSATMAR